MAQMQNAFHKSSHQGRHQAPVFASSKSEQANKISAKKAITPLLVVFLQQKERMAIIRAKANHKKASIMLAI
jgi:hypothetical protein